MNFANVLTWRQLPDDTGRLLTKAGYGPDDIAGTSDEELSRIEGLGPKKLATIRRLFPYRAIFKSGKGVVGVHASFNVTGDFGEAEREYLNNAVSDSLQKLCRQKRVSQDNFRTKVKFIESRTFTKSPRAVMEMDGTSGITNFMSEIPLEVMTINAHEPTVHHALRTQNPDDINLIPSDLNKQNSDKYGLFHLHESDTLPEDVERYFRYAEDAPEVNRYVRTVIRMLKLEGKLQ